MRNEIEVFLSKNPSKSFRAGEIARRLKMPKGDAKRRLKKLAKQGRVVVKKGRYRVLVIEPADSIAWSARRLGETARRVGLSVESLQRWVEERRRRASDEETKKLLYGILHDVERSKGTKTRN
jgi:DNA-binding MarR family transcriptional regulator